MSDVMEVFCVVLMMYWKGMENYLWKHVGTL